MRNCLKVACFVILLPGILAAQFPPTTVPQQKPTLRRDRTQRVLNPKVVQLEDERVVTDELVDLLILSHGGLVKRAIIALGRIGSAAGVAPLISVLNSSRSDELRSLAAFSLGEIESHYAASDLLEKLDSAKEASPAVRTRAAEALGKIAANRLSAASLGKYGVTSIANVLARQLPSTAAQPSEEARSMGAITLTALLRLKQPSTVPAIAAQLRSPDPELRWQAANALARIGADISTATPVLLGLLDDPEPLARAHSARALGVAGERMAVEPLIRRLTDPDQRVVANSINALGTLEDPRAVEPLIAFGRRQLEGFKTAGRERGVPTQQNLLLLTATALGNIKDERAVDLLHSIRLEMGGVGSSPEVEIALGRFGETAFFDAPEGSAFPEADWKRIAAYAQGLGAVKGEQARSTLLGLLKGKTNGAPDPRAVPEILNAMAASGVETLRDLLLEQLKAEDVIVRATAATLIGGLGDSSDAVIQGLKAAYRAARNDRMNDARIAVIEAAHKLNHPMNIEVLADPTRDADYVVRTRAVELMRQSAEDGSILKLQAGPVETGHDRNYWRRIARLLGLPRNPVAIIHTAKGPIRIELFASDAPMTVDNFIQLSRGGYYDGLTFMRVVPNFVVQGGDPRNDMNGGPGYQIRCEINMRPYLTGTIGMALSGKDTGGSQFFITHSPQPHLDGGYTAFGQVVAGMDTVNAIARGDRIERIEILNDPGTLDGRQ